MTLDCLISFMNSSGIQKSKGDSHNKNIPLASPSFIDSLLRALC